MDVKHTVCRHFLLKIVRIWKRMNPPRIAFFGTPLLAQVCLDALQRSFGVSLVVTKTDSECGRGKRITQCPVKEYAEEHGIDVYQKADLNTGALTL